MSSPNKKNKTGSPSRSSSPKKSVKNLSDGFSREDIKRTVRPWYEDLMEALRFLTRLPIHDDEMPSHGQNLRRAARAFPLTGLIVGGAGAAVILLAYSFQIPNEVAVILALATMVLITGGLHEDGLADSSDALFATTDHEERMEILKDSHSGVFAVLAIIFVVLLKWSVLASMMEVSTLDAARAIIGASVLSRIAFLVPVCFLNPIKEDGLGAALGSLTPPSMIVPLIAGVTPVFFILFGNIIALTMSLVAAAVMAFAISFLAQKNLSGYNGDIAGATQQLSETAVLITLSITLI